MRVVTRARFARDLKKIRGAKPLAKVRDCLDSASPATSIGDLDDVLPMTDHKNDYRVRVGEHRIGLYPDGDAIEFVRCLPRRDFYRSFP
jgi:mRNA interferase RelE/StbE